MISADNLRYPQLLDQLPNQPKTWLITGVAGFIGSNLLEHLLKLNQRVVGLDNFATGHQSNLDEVQSLVSPEQWSRFTFIEGDIRNPEDCARACEGVDYVLHQAALGSVPRSLNDPITTNAANITGFLNMLVAARDAGVKSYLTVNSIIYDDDFDEMKKQILFVTEVFEEISFYILMRNLGGFVGHPIDVLGNELEVLDAIKRSLLFG